MSSRRLFSIEKRTDRSHRPFQEGLEDRRLLASGLSGTAIAQAIFTGTGPNQAPVSSTRPLIAISVTDQAVATGNTVTVSLVSVDGALLAPGATSGTIPLGTTGTSGQTGLTVPIDLGVGSHTVTVLAKDSTGNTATFTTAPFTVVAGTPTSAPATPVYSTTYDLSQISQLFPNSPPGQNLPEHDWTISFDRTTQTIWVALRGGELNIDPMTGTSTDPEPNGGNRIIQFDPATDTAKVYNLQNLPNVDLGTDPHGIFFDFESHLTPRVWFTQRPNGIMAGQDLGFSGRGEVSYFDLATGQLVVYDLANELRALGYPHLVGDFHGVSVDRSGSVWVSDPDDGLLLQLDTTRNPNGTTNGSLDSDSGTLIVHKVPPEILGVAQSKGLKENLETGPHGIDTVVGQDGQQYIYATDLGAGRVILLRPSLTPGGPDRWTTWDMSTVLQGGGPNASPGIIGGAPQFTTVDNGETPDNPFDDKIYIGDPGSDTGAFGDAGPNNVIRVIDVGAYLKGQNVTTSPIQTWALPSQPGQPGQPANTANARPNEVFVDREGTVYYIDRQYGIGRLDTTNLAAAGALKSTGAVVDARVIEAATSSNSYPLAPLQRINLPTPIPVTLATHKLQGSQNTADQSNVAGLNQWSLEGSGSAKSSRQARNYLGPFRGTLNAGGDLYNSLTQSDQLSTTVFAETARRQMSFVTGAGDSRMAFQVFRDGSLVMTGRGVGQFLDQQVNLTQAIGGLALQNPIHGDTGAIADGDGNVHVYGRNAAGAMIAYVYTAKTETWGFRVVGMPRSGFLTTTPTPYLDPNHGISILATDDSGHLINFHEDGAPPDDLTALGGGDAGLVYSTPDLVRQGDMFYAYDTNQRGGLIEYKWPVAGGAVTFHSVNLGGGSETRMFQDTSVVLDGVNRLVFGTDGNSRLVEATITPNGESAQNITEMTKAGAVGYSAYQQPYAARVYTDVSVARAPNGDLYVYGTNARELIEFFKPSGGNWQATDVTNSLPANKVFGAPSVYITPSGDRHILQINEDGEVVEYYRNQGEPWSTQNITLSLGHSGSPPIFPTRFPAVVAPPVTPAPVPVLIAPLPPAHKKTPPHHQTHPVKVAHPHPTHKPTVKPVHHAKPTVHPVQHKVAVKLPNRGARH